MTQSQQSLLIVDDDARFAEALALEFQERGWRVDCVADLDELRALPAFAHRFASVDLRLRHQNGLDSIPLILERSPRVRIVVLTGYGSIATAVQAVKQGAFNYLTKPVHVEDLLQAFRGEPLQAPAGAAQAGQTLAPRASSGCTGRACSASCASSRRESEPGLRALRASSRSLRG